MGLLEDSVIGTCRGYALRTHTTAHPGVWVGPGTDEDRKIASVGVHLRRNIASHGIGLNVSVDLGWFDRIVACGLVGRKATSIEWERNLIRSSNTGHMSATSQSAEREISVAALADSFADNVSAQLPKMGGEVAKVSEVDVWPGP